MLVSMSGVVLTVIKIIIIIITFATSPTPTLSRTQLTLLYWLSRLSVAVIDELSVVIHSLSVSGTVT